MRPQLQRFTTRYIDLEDRFQLAGELAGKAAADAAAAAPVVIWLTRRLLDRLLPELLQWLERQLGDTPRGEALQSFAQQAARAGLAAEAPVRAAAGSAAWLAQAVDIARAEREVVLTFRSGDGNEAALRLAATPLRQWLGIVYDGYRSAGWPLDVWPQWLRESAAPPARPAVMLH